MRISDWSSDVCSSDLTLRLGNLRCCHSCMPPPLKAIRQGSTTNPHRPNRRLPNLTASFSNGAQQPYVRSRSEEHTSELQSLMRISYAVFCLKKNNNSE